MHTIFITSEKLLTYLVDEEFELQYNIIIMSHNS